MILSKKPLSIVEVNDYMKDKEANEVVIEYLKRFGKMSKDKTNKIKEALTTLNNPKIKEEHIIRVIDFLPKDQEDINKIFLDASLNEEEARAILEIVKNN